MWPFHAYLLIAFPQRTLVFAATADAGSALRDVSDDAACEYQTQTQTVYACTMFGGQGVAQVCPALALFSLHAVCHALWPRRCSGMYCAGAVPKHCMLYLCQAVACAHFRAVCQAVACAHFHTEPAPHTMMQRNTQQYQQGAQDHDRPGKQHVRAPPTWLRWCLGA